MPAPDASLADTLRAWRERLSPVDAGVVSHGERRTPGLRREELAALSGISADYITRIEQGRSRRPSPEVVSALAAALQLSNSERNHLYGKAGLQAPRDDLVPNNAPDSVQRLVTRLTDLPVAAFTADWQLIRWTRLWRQLFGDPSQLPPERRNYALMFFRQRPDQEIDQDAFERSLVSDLRRTAQRYPKDQGLRSLIAELSTDSRFCELWRDGENHPHTGSRKILDHPTVGQVSLDCDILQTVDTDHRIVVFTAVGPADQDKLEMLRSTSSDCPV